jgi:3-oxoacyl-[acyl-carrier protein] reductase
VQYTEANFADPDAPRAVVAAASAAFGHVGRWGEPDDAARLVAWLCSDEASWITAQVIDSEGGFRR